MKISLLAFGIAREILGISAESRELESQMTVKDYKQKLCDEYPDFQKLVKFDIAVNEEYRSDDYIINDQDEVAIIPPVSGG